MAKTIPIHAAAATEPRDADSATQFFRNYTKRQPRVPMAVWWAARAATLGVTALLVVLLLWRPELGLKLCWGLAIPLVPALLVVAPGLWRQVCPMATLNQLPRLGGFTRALDLPTAWKNAAFGISVLLFLGAVSMRVPLLNGNGLLVGLGILTVLALAFLGGLFFKGRSGWCGTFCPLAPVQRQASALLAAGALDEIMRLCDLEVMPPSLGLSRSTGGSLPLEVTPPVSGAAGGGGGCIAHQGEASSASQSVPGISTTSSSQVGGSGGGAELIVGGGCGAGGKRKRG
jgi:hypothetical protein